jgi:hypothetical protein
MRSPWLPSARLGAAAGALLMACTLLPPALAGDEMEPAAAAARLLARVLGCPQQELTLSALSALPPGHVWANRVGRYRFKRLRAEGSGEGDWGLLLVDARNTSICRLVFYNRLARATKFGSSARPPDPLRSAAQAIAVAMSGLDVPAMKGPQVRAVQSRLYEYIWQERAEGGAALTGTTVGVALSPATREWVSLSVWRASPKVTAETVGVSEATARGKALERVRSAPDVDVGERGQLILSIPLVAEEGPGWVFELRDRHTGHDGQLVIDAQTGAVVASTMNLPAE